MPSAFYLTNIELKCYLKLCPFFVAHVYASCVHLFFSKWPFRGSLLPNTFFILLGSEIEQLLIGGFNSTGKILINFLFVFGN